jgi:hypothetical protein
LDKLFEVDNAPSQGAVSDRSALSRLSGVGIQGESAHKKKQIKPEPLRNSVEKSLRSSGRYNSTADFNHNIPMISAREQNLQKNGTEVSSNGQLFDSTAAKN